MAADKLNSVEPIELVVTPAQVIDIKSVVSFDFMTSSIGRGVWRQSVGILRKAPRFEAVDPQPKTCKP